MTRLSRIACAAALVLAVGTVPLVADWCAAVCESAHATTANVPACHHAGSTTARIGNRPAPCSHDHHAAVVDAATSIAVASRSIAVAPALAVEWSSAPSGSIQGEGPVRGAATASPPLTLKLASNLRI